VEDDVAGINRQALPPPPERPSPRAPTWRASWDHALAVEWFTKGAEVGLPKARFNLGLCLEEGEGMAAPDYPAAADWYRRAADAGHAGAANNLSTFFTLGRGRACQIMPAASSAMF